MATEPIDYNEATTDQLLAITGGYHLHMLNRLDCGSDYARAEYACLLSYLNRSLFLRHKKASKTYQNVMNFLDEIAIRRFPKITFELLKNRVLIYLDGDSRYVLRTPGKRDLQAPLSDHIQTCALLSCMADSKQELAIYDPRNFVPGPADALKVFTLHTKMSSACMHLHAGMMVDMLNNLFTRPEISREECEAAKATIKGALRSVSKKMLLKAAALVGVVAAAIAFLVKAFGIAPF